MKRAFIDMTPEAFNALLRLRDNVEVVDVALQFDTGVNFRLHFRGDGLPAETETQEGQVSYRLDSLEDITLSREVPVGQVDGLALKLTPEMTIKYATLSTLLEAELSGIAESLDIIHTCFERTAAQCKAGYINAIAFDENFTLLVQSIKAASDKAKAAIALGREPTGD